MSGTGNKSGLTMNEQRRKDVPLISAYGKGGFTINGRDIAGIVMILPHDVIALPVAELAQLTSSMLEPLFELSPAAEIVLIGTGQKMAPLPANLKAVFSHQGYMPDIMDSGAAARTFNILQLEDRRVVALLQPV